MRSTRTRSITIAVISLLALYQITPTLIYFAQPKEVRNDEERFLQKVPGLFPQSHVKLGLDLQGGVQFVLGVETESAIADKLSRIGIEAKRWGSEAQIDVQAAYVPDGQQFLTIQLTDPNQVNTFREQFAKLYPQLVARRRGDAGFEFRFKDDELKRIHASASEQAEKVIRNRIDQWGVSEPLINRRSDGSILVQLPGFRDPEKAKELIGRTVQLRFKIVDDGFTGFDAIAENALPDGIQIANNDGHQKAFSGEDREALEAFLTPHIPEDHSLHFSRQELSGGAAGRTRWTSFVTFATTELSGDDIHDAFIGQGGDFSSQPVVSLTLTPAGGRQFARVTGQNIKKRLAVVLDGVIESAPVINQKIPNGLAQISLGGSRAYNELVEEGTKLALILKSGAIPATIKILEERQVGSTLGPELANQGIRGIFAGLLLVLAFMIFYYRRPGALACIALVLNAVILLAVMAAFGFALTLPGIAGFVLTLGMAVDANVLINERIQQEILEGRNPRKAIDSGFDKVVNTILDANLTTLIAAFVLLETNGSGPIRGFAITLIFGLLVSLFTALYVTRWLFHLVTARVSDTQLRSWLGVQRGGGSRFLNVDWLRIGRPATYLCAAFAVAILVITGVRGLNFGVDFSGGTEMMVGFASDVEPKQIEAIGQKAQVDGITLQALEGSKRQYLVRYDESREDAQGVRVEASEQFQRFKSTLEADLAPAKPEIYSVDFVGPQVGRELRTQGLLSILYSILAVILYIGFRFDMRFSPGALIKMVLDMILMLGFYTIFQVSFDLVGVAAFLTVVGYSVNDTIVIYDRIRENMSLFPRRPLHQNINLAISETLGRSINTSLTTVLSLSGIILLASGQIWNFAVALGIGVAAATVTSILVASTFVVWLEQWNSRRSQPAGASSSATS